MKMHFLFYCIFCFVTANTFAQEVPNETEQQLENLTEAEDAETEDDYYLQELSHYKKSPLNLNNAEAEDLQDLRVLTDLQIQNFLSYRRLLGKLISVYELQAIPSWDIITIKRLLPYIIVSNAQSFTEQIASRFSKGDHIILLRASQILKRSKGLDPAVTGTKYTGSPQHIFARYKCSYKNLLQYGITADKDPGEQFFKGYQKSGFDFYSFHLFARKLGLIKAIAVGDYTVSMGQGLIQWQAMAFKKNAGVTGIKRQSSILKPYNSAGEYNFHRGAAMTIGKRNWEATAFISFRNLSANTDQDAATGETFFTSFQTSGYHRTLAEIEDKNALKQTSFGANINYTIKGLHVGINSIYYKFSMGLEKRDDPYNLYAISGNQWGNSSIDYSYTFRNMHVFGEAAIDKNLNKAFINGLLVSVDPKVDVSVLHRSISPAYQSINANAFTENTLPSNENGIYAGIVVRPIAVLQLQAYADVYRFPWLKYLVDAPSSGRDYFIQFNYTPNKKLEIYTRYKTEAKQKNISVSNAATNSLSFFTRKNWRLHVNYTIDKTLSFRSRIDMLWNKSTDQNPTTGFLMFADILYKPMFSPVSATMRLQYFETDDYDSRIYAYENDVLYSYSIPGFFNKGYRYYLLLNFKLPKEIRIDMRWAQTIYSNISSIGSGLDEISGNKKSEIKLQVIKEF